MLIRTISCRSLVLLTSLASLFSLQLVHADGIQEAQQLLADSGVKGGFVVQLGLGDGQRLAALKANDSYQVHGLDRDADAVARMRLQLQKSDIYGPVAVDQLASGTLPYIDNLVNLFVAEQLDDVSMEEVRRVLVPNGVAMIKDAQGQWQKTVKLRTKAIDEWSHFLHDASGNAVAHDEVVAPPRHLQWVGSPRYSRHHDRMASMSALVSTNGRMFYIMDEGSRISIQLPPKWKLIARDAFNGTILWKRDIATWQSHLWPLKSGPTQLSRRLVSTAEVVYTTLGYDAPLSALDAATGNSLREFAGTDGTEEIIHTDGLLFLVVRKGKAELADYTPVNPTVGDQALARDLFWNEEPRVVMAFEAESGRMLWAKQTKISPLTLAAGKDQVYFHDGEKLVSIHQRTGQVQWQTEPVTRRNQFNFNFGPRLVVHEDVVLYAGGDGKMISVSAVDGKQLWTAQHPNSGYQSPQDLMVMQGLVWSAPTTSGKDTGIFSGRDPKTGEVKKEFPPNIDTYWFHHRCYIAKATDNFIIPSRTGVEFVDPQQQNWDIHHWVRGGCLYGIMPCNGLTYTPPHDCACYPEAKLFGFNALAPMAPTRPIPAEVPEEGRLEQGPAWGRPMAASYTADNDNDWPTYRHDPARSGTASKPIPANVSPQWKIKLGGRLTAPVIAGGLVYVAQTDSHTLFALDAEQGKQRWKFTAGARIDSPPTIHRGRVVFGATDGWVYCLDDKDGALVWRYRAAPLDRRTMAFEQLESLWPVHGSVLVRDDVLYCVAGRSNFLDGGLRLLRLQVADGKKLTENIMDETNPDTGNNLQEKLQILQMPVGLPDILSADDKFLYMKSQKFDFEGKRLAIGPNSGDFVKQASVQRGEGEHLFAPMGFLDDTWFHRSYWVLGQSFAGGHGGYFQAGRFAPSGQLMVKGNGYVFGYGRKPQYLRWTTTMEHQLFAAEPSPPEIPADFGKGNAAAGAGAFAQFPKSPSLDATGKPITLEAWMTATNPNGVIVARGGPAEGFALTLEGGLPMFHVRSGGNLASIKGTRRIVGGWHHVVGVLQDNRAMQLYVDGELAGNGQATGLLTKDPAQGLEVAADIGGAVGNYESPFGFTGVIDEVRLYFASVDAEAVKKRFESDAEMSADPRLVVTFDDGSARDLSLHRNNGTLEGGVPIDGHTGKGVRFSNNPARLNANNNAAAPADDGPNKKPANANANANRPGKNARGNAANNKPAGQNAAANNSLIKPKWTSDIPVYARAMVLAGDELFVAGPLDMIDEEETFKKLSEKDAEVQQLLNAQDDALNGGVGGLLLSVNCATGEVDQRLELGTLPSWDGMAGAAGKLFMTTVDGQVMCYGVK
ncbi:MAG: PQQ-binding-like beta-propeller repeat protein [Pirellulaceae bacterium]|nr:PQQ-binding-like beta-propeller repeat protein [Pirellulaceae bacterium]